jgi:hypothetical protein
LGGCTAASTVSYCSLVPPGKKCTIAKAMVVLLIVFVADDASEAAQ